MSLPPLDPEVQAVRSDPYQIHPLILNRWSPRSFMERPVAEPDLLAVLEAAHWAPSSSNEQPWRFIVCRGLEDRQRLLTCLNPSNREWAVRAPVLMVVLSNPVFMDKGKPNRWAAFDSGTAWGFLALEARHRGLITHAMGGFSQDQVRETFQVPLEWGIHAVVALGYRGPAEALSEYDQERERPSLRKPLGTLWTEGRFTF